MIETILLKLTSGETIICDTEDYSEIYDKKTVSIKLPAVLNHVRMPRGNFMVESYILLPWCSFSSEEIFSIPTSQIVLATKVKKELKENYIDFIMRKNDRSSSNHTSVQIEEDDEEDEETNEILSLLQEGNDNDENDEEEEERIFGRGSQRSTRILH